MTVDPMRWNQQTWLGWALGLLFLLAPRPARAGDWPQFLGPNRNGEALEHGMRESLAAPGPPFLWRRPIGDGFSSPVVVGNRLILFHQVGGDETIECLDTSNAAVVWKSAYPSQYAGGYGTGPGPRATPTIVNDRVFTFGSEAVLQCSQLETGKVLWRRELQRDFRIPENFFGIGSSPLVSEGRVFVNVGSPNDGGMAAFDAATGKTLWTATRDTASYASPIAGTIEGRPWLFCFARSGLHGLDPANGRVRFFLHWRARINASVNAATPLLVGNQIFLSSSYGTGAALVTVRGDGHTITWASDDVLSCHYNTPVYHAGYLYGIDGRQEGGARLRCVELATGKIQWTVEGYGCAAILRVGDRLLLWGEQGQLELAKASPRAFISLGKAQILRGTCRPVPAFANGILYVRSETELAAVDLRPVEANKHGTTNAAKGP